MAMETGADNDYDKDVFNGDIGRVAKIDEVEQEVVVRFDIAVKSMDARRRVTLLKQRLQACI